MKFKITDDGNFIQAVDFSENEYAQLEFSFSKKPANYFILKKRMPHWDPEIKFVSKFGMVPIGLYNELVKMGKTFQIPIEIEGVEQLINTDYNETDFDEWVEEHFENSEITPRYYQVDAAKAILKYMKCTEEISTSGGKTLISYMLFRYLFDRKKIKKMLYIVPNIGLIEQSEDKFYEYDEKCGITEPDWKSICVFSGNKKRNEIDANIVFGTYQSITKKELDYFREFDVIFTDECLHPDTLITMYDYSKKKIKDIKIGEKVWTYNEYLHILEIKEVEFVYKNLSKSEQIFELELDNGQILKITGNHKVLTILNIWKRIDEINEGDDIIDFNLVNI